MKRIAVLFSLLLALTVAASAQLSMSGVGGGFGKAAGGGGPPSLTFLTYSAQASGSTTQVSSPFTLPSSGGPYWVGFTIAAISGGGAVTLSAPTLAPTNGTGSCVVDTQTNSGSTVWGLVHCTTTAANPGSTTFSITFSANTFNGTNFDVWYAPSGGFNSTTPVGTNSSTTAAAASASITAASTNTGFCIAGSAINTQPASPAVSSAGSTFTYTQRDLTGGNGSTAWGADTTASSSTTATTAVAWSGTAFTTGIISLGVGCWF